MSTKEEQIIVIRQFDSPIEANIVKGLLEANEIPCFLSDENIIGLNPLYNPAMGGVKLQIFERDREVVEKLLAENHNIQSDNENTDTQKCPRCGSTNVKYGQSTKKRFSLLVLLISILMMVYPFKALKSYHCFDCGNEFR